MQHTTLIKAIALPIICALVVLATPHSSPAADLQRELNGALVWFYTLEVQDGKERGNVLKFKQTAGVSVPNHVIHDIRPLSPQSKVTQDEDENWFLDLAPERVVVTKDRPLFLGQVLSISKSGNVPKRLNMSHNVPVRGLKYDDKLARYLVDRKDLLITDPAITAVRDNLIDANPRLLNYIIAVDHYVHDRLDYGECDRPNTAVDLLGFSKGRCGEYAKLKQSLLRYCCSSFWDHERRLWRCVLS